LKQKRFLYYFLLQCNGMFYKRCYNAFMKIKPLIILVLLLSMSTTVLAEHIFNSHAEDSCASTHHTISSDIKDSSKDLHLHNESHCEIHCDLHHVYLLPQHKILTLAESTTSLSIKKNDAYIYQENLEFFKPPII